MFSDEDLKQLITYLELEQALTKVREILQDADPQVKRLFLDKKILEKYREIQLHKAVKKPDNLN